MGRGILLWLLGVPIPIIILILLFWHRRKRMARAVSEIGAVVADRVPEESAKSATSWGAVIAGGVAAAVATLVLMLVGAGLGLTLAWPFSNQGRRLARRQCGRRLADCRAMAVGPARRLHGRPAAHQMGQSAHGRSLFRDTAHGFLAWALATLLVAGMLSSTISAIIGAGVQAASNVAGGAATAGAAAATTDGGDTTAYFVDTLLRPADPARPLEGGEQTSAEVARILLASAASGEMATDDRLPRTARRSARRTDARGCESAGRRRAAAGAGDGSAGQTSRRDARKAGATFALVGALSLFIGAFIASAAAALGGRLRDANEGP